MHTYRRISTAVPAALCALVFAAPASAQKEPGDHWEVTTQMSMMGMSMPGQTTKVCAARNAVPVGDDGKCETYDVKQTPASVSWKTRCKGNPPTSGSGEITYQGRDRYTGTILMTMGKDTMTMKLTGRRLGECDAGENKRMAAAAQQQMAAGQKAGAEAMAKACADAVANMQPMLLKPEMNAGCSPKHREEFCARFKQPDGFAKVPATRTAGMAPMDDAGKLCGVQPDALRASLCKNAEAEETMGFLASSCVGYGNPPWGAKIAARECAGRSFSSPAAPKYRSFCSAYARRNLMKGNAQAEEAADAPAPAPTATRTAPPPAQEPAAQPQPAEDALSKGKALLKGLFR